MLTLLSMLMLMNGPIGGSSTGSASKQPPDRQNENTEAEWKPSSTFAASLIIFFLSETIAYAQLLLILLTSSAKCKTLNSSLSSFGVNKAAVLPDSWCSSKKSAR